MIQASVKLKSRGVGSVEQTHIQISAGSLQCSFVPLLSRSPPAVRPALDKSSERGHNYGFTMLSQCHFLPSPSLPLVLPALDKSSETAHNYGFTMLSQCHFLPSPSPPGVLPNHLKQRISTASQCCHNVTFYRVSITARCPPSCRQII